MIVGYVVDDEEDSVDEGADDDCFFFVVDRFLQTSTLLALTNAAVLLSSARPPYSFSRRNAISDQAALHRPSCRGGGTAEASVLSSLGHYHRDTSDCPISSLFKRWASSLLWLVRSLNRPTCSNLDRQ